MLLGDRRRFAVDIGDRNGIECRVDLWAADQWLTCDDNSVYTRAFRHAVGVTLDRLRAGHGSPPPFAGASPADNHRRLYARAGTDDETSADWEPGHRYELLHAWGPTIDNVEILVFRDGGRLAMTFRFWRDAHLRAHPEHPDRVFTAALPMAEFVGVLANLAAALDAGPA